MRAPRCGLLCGKRFGRVTSETSSLDGMFRSIGSRSIGSRIPPKRRPDFNVPTSLKVSIRQVKHFIPILRGPEHLNAEGAEIAEKTKEPRRLHLCDSASSAFQFLSEDNI